MWELYIQIGSFQQGSPRGPCLPPGGKGWQSPVVPSAALFCPPNRHLQHSAVLEGQTVAPSCAYTALASSRVCSAAAEALAEGTPVGSAPTSHRCAPVQAAALAALQGARSDSAAPAPGPAAGHRLLTRARCRCECHRPCSPQPAPPRRGTRHAARLAGTQGCFGQQVPHRSLRSHVRLLCSGTGGLGPLLLDFFQEMIFTSPSGVLCCLRPPQVLGAHRRSPPTVTPRRSSPRGAVFSRGPPGWLCWGTPGGAAPAGV